MSKGPCALLLPLLLFSFFFLNDTSLHSTSANTAVTNLATVYYSSKTVQTNAVVTVGPIYGLSEIYSSSNYYLSPPNYQYRIPMAVTNQGNDADSNMTVFAEFLSNNSGYAGSNWSCFLEVNASNVGTNYTVPFADFGEGAVFNYNLVVNLPLVCPTGSLGFLRSFAATDSNATHVAAVYTGLNSVSYGGKDSVTNALRVEIFLPNGIASISASDGYETIGVFDGTRGLRHSQQTVEVELLANPVNFNNVFYWYSIDSVADGPGGANPSDAAVRMRHLYGRVFQAVLAESAVQTGGFMSFLFEVDGVLYINNYLYLLYDVGAQGAYQTVLMHNVIEQEGGESIYLKLPAKLTGQQGKVTVYSVSGDMVQTILSGQVQNQILSWDGRDRTGAIVSKGMYFLLVDFADVKEVRRVFVK